MVNAAKKDARWEKWAAADSDYVTQAARLAQLLRRSNLDATTASAQRSQDFSRAMNELGFNQAQGTWNELDKTRGIGQATNALNQNFADRGMVRSTGYDTSGSQLRTDFNQKQADLSNELTRAENQQTLDMQRATEDTEQARLQARNEAVKRRQARLSSGLY
jgi:hypothetical protein